MRSRFLLPLLTSLSLPLVAACGGSSDEVDHHDEEHHDGDDDDHHDGDDDHHDGGSSQCSHVGLEGPPCDDEVDLVGATASSDSYTVEVVSTEPTELTEGADESFEITVEITDDTGAAVDDAELERVYTEAHGGHNSCGNPGSESMGDGAYHVDGLSYPHKGTWFHEFTIDGETLTLALCVGAP